MEARLGEGGEPPYSRRRHDVGKGDFRMVDDDFKGAVRAVRGRLGTAGFTYLNNQVAVREQLVAPILGAVGWHTDDGSEVQSEESADGDVSRYILKQNGNPKVIVEAVTSGTSIESVAAVTRLAEDALRGKVDYGLLTNGRTWILVSVRTAGLGPGPNPRIEWLTRIDQETVSSFRGKLARVSRQSAAAATQ
jgi:predicted type IV restriction endonuclease